MKILVASDSHGNKQALLDAVDREAPHLILHLGDHDRDCDIVRSTYARIPLRAVRGNGDLRSMEPINDEFVLEGKRFFMTHGHQYGVKGSLDAVLNAAHLRRAHVLLFGHTHRPGVHMHEGLLVINPGSIGLGAKTYAVLDIQHGAIQSKIVNFSDPVD